MVPISEVFETVEFKYLNLFEEIELEQFIEDLSFQSTLYYGDDFVEAVNDYLENDNSSNIDFYFESSLVLLNEAVEGVNIAPEDLEYAKERVKNIGGKEIKKGKKTSLVRKITKRLYKNKVGRAIVRGVRRAGYGTKIGRKIMTAQAKRRLKQKEQLIDAGQKATKLAGKLTTVGKALERHPDASEFQKSFHKKLGDVLSKKSGKIARDVQSRQQSFRNIRTGMRITEPGFKKKQASKTKTKTTGKLIAAPA